MNFVFEDFNSKATYFSSNHEISILFGSHILTFPKPLPIFFDKINCLHDCHFVRLPEVTQYFFPFSFMFVIANFPQLDSLFFFIPTFALMSPIKILQLNGLRLSSYCCRRNSIQFFLPNLSLLVHRYGQLSQCTTI